MLFLHSNSSVSNLWPAQQSSQSISISHKNPIQQQCDWSAGRLGVYFFYLDPISRKKKHSSYTLYFLTVQAGFIVNKLRSAICVLKCFLLIFATEAYWKDFLLWLKWMEDSWLFNFIELQLMLRTDSITSMLTSVF